MKTLRMSVPPARGRQSFVLHRREGERQDFQSFLLRQRRPETFHVGGSRPAVLQRCSLRVPEQRLPLILSRQIPPRSRQLSTWRYLPGGILLHEFYDSYFGLSSLGLSLPNRTLHSPRGGNPAISIPGRAEHKNAQTVGLRKDSNIFFHSRSSGSTRVSWWE